MCFKHQNTMAATMVSFSLTKDYCTLKWRLPNGFLRKQFLTETSTTAKQKLELGFRGMILLYDVLVKRKWQRRIDMMLYLFEFESRKLRLFKMEDVSMGMWVKKFNSSKPVEYMHSLKFCQFGCIEGYFTAHYQSPRQMICMWG